MVFVSYAPATKVAVVRMSLKGYSLSAICNTLGYLVLPQSLTQWKDLYEETHAVIQDSNEYAQRGRAKLLSTEDSQFMQQLVHNEPGLFLTEIRERLYDGTQVMLSLQAVHQNLVDQLLITLKKAETSKIKKCLLSKYQWVERMKFVPAEFMVFVGKVKILSVQILHEVELRCKLSCFRFLCPI
jgi:5'(3')-deoxyribonucleotidase